MNQPTQPTPRTDAKIATIQDLRLLMDSGEFHHATYRNHGTAKASELKIGILEHPQLVKAPKILVDLYKRIEKPARHSFD